MKTKVGTELCITEAQTGHSFDLVGSFTFEIKEHRR